VKIHQSTALHLISQLVRQWLAKATKSNTHTTLVPTTWLISILPITSVLLNPLQFFIVLKSQNYSLYYILMLLSISLSFFIIYMHNISPSNNMAYFHTSQLCLYYSTLYNSIVLKSQNYSWYYISILYQSHWVFVSYIFRCSFCWCQRYLR
jgi:hypothetical protein